jgi:hypothetical protein
MNNAILLGHKRQLDDLFGRAEALYQLVRNGGFDYEFEIQSDFARYLCIRVCGLVDVAVNFIISSYVTRHAPQELNRFAFRTLGRHQNLKSERLVELIGQFHEAWASDLKVFLTEHRRDALNSLVDNRNSIAHGASVDITHERVREYYLPVLELITFLERRCLE